jgi:RNA-directed DNA polymerase
MIKAPINLQELRRRIYAKAKAESTWRFWGLYVHVCKTETLMTAYTLVRANHGAPGIDGVTFDDIETGTGVEHFVEQIRYELVQRTYRPMRNRRCEIPKDGNKVRVLSVPSIRDRVVQGALKLILEPIFEADFQPGSYGYRPKRSAHDAIRKVAHEIRYRKTRVIDLDLRAYFDNVRHDVLLAKLAQRIRDDDVMHLLKLILKATGKKGVPQGGVISPLASNIYLNEVDRMLEKAKKATRDRYTHVEYARFADDLVVLVDGYTGHEKLLWAVDRRLREELAKLSVEVNEENTKVVDLAMGESFGFLGFDFRQLRSIGGKLRPQYTPKLKKRTVLLRSLKHEFRRRRSQPVRQVVEAINPVLRGSVNYFAIGHSRQCFGYICLWVEKKVRRHLMRAAKRPGFGWNKWSTRWLYDSLGLFDGYQLDESERMLKALPT